MKVKYLFIDGACLINFVYDCIRRYPIIQFEEIDWRKVFLGYNKIFYYDALPPYDRLKNEEELTDNIKEKEKFFDSLREISGVHVYEGDTRIRKRRGMEQKKVDIMIAVDMLTHTFRKNMNFATLLTADLDFKPLIDACVADGMHVELWYPHKKPNRSLIFSADQRRPMNIRNVWAWCNVEFLHKHPLPKAFSQPQIKEFQGDFVKEFEINSRPVQLYYKPDKNVHCIVFPSDANRTKNYYTYVEYNDLQVLKSYVQECFGEFWSSQV